ncbi:MAG: 5'-methylthioadenosine/S-adenosylhomocysteine nucleosidase [Bacteroidota bacterium]
MKQEVPIIHNVWFSPRKYGIFSWRKPSVGTLAISDKVLYFRGLEEEFSTDKISQLRHIRMPGDFSRNWIAMTYEKAVGVPRTVYFAEDARSLGLGCILGGSLNLFDALRSVHDRPFRADVVLLTPIEVEYRAVLHHLDNIQTIETPRGKLYTYGTFQGTHKNWKVAVVQSGSGIGPTTEAALLAADFFSPKIMMLVGVAGGIQKVKVGDIVVGTKGINYEFGKEVKDRFLPRVEFVQHSNRLIERAKYVYRTRNWLLRIPPRSDTSTFPKKNIDVHFGTIASGNKVLTDERSALVQRIKTQYNDVLAVEMEAAGLQVLARNHPGIHTLNVRCISDLLSDKAKSDAEGIQSIAADRAAAFVFELLLTQTKIR